MGGKPKQTVHKKITIKKMLKQAAIINKKIKKLAKGKPMTSAQIKVAMKRILNKKIKTSLKHIEGKKVAIEKISIKGLKFEKITAHTKLKLLKKQLKLAKTVSKKKEIKKKLHHAKKTLREIKKRIAIRKFTAKKQKFLVKISHSKTQIQAA